MKSLDKNLLNILRNNAKKGLEVCLLIKMIQDNIDSNEYNSFLVMNYFMKAFNLSLSQVRELPGAFCLGGGVYSDQEINILIYKQINSNCSQDPSLNENNIKS